MVHYTNIIIIASEDDIRLNGKCVRVMVVWSISQLVNKKRQHCCIVQLFLVASLYLCNTTTLYSARQEINE